MANPEHLQILEQGVAVWNTWREQNRDIIPDISEAELGGARLGGANFFRTNLREAKLGGAFLFRANLREADLHGAFLYMGFQEH